MYVFTLSLPFIFVTQIQIFIQSLQHRSEVLFTTIPAHTSTSLPDELQGYHSLSPLEPTVGERRKFGNWYSVVYKARQAEDGSSVVLRRIESAFSLYFFSFRRIPCIDVQCSTDYRLTHQAAFGAIDKWSRIHHPNLVGVREAFTTRAFNDNCTYSSALTPLALLTHTQSPSRNIHLPPYFHNPLLHVPLFPLPIHSHS